MDLDDLLNEYCLPRSSLKVIDESLKCEVCRNVNKHDTMGIGCLEHKMMDPGMYDKDNEDEIVELATKCYDSDS